MRGLSMLAFGLAGALVLTALALPALAQVGPGGAIVPQRDCQVLKSCRFTTGGSFRGCISAYSCRVCRLVTGRCTISGREQTCREMRCGWGA